MPHILIFYEDNPSFSFDKIIANNEELQKRIAGFDEYGNECHYKSKRTRHLLLQYCTDDAVATEIMKTSNYRLLKDEDIHYRIIEKDKLIVDQDLDATPFLNFQLNLQKIFTNVSLSLLKPQVSDEYKLSDDINSNEYIQIWVKSTYGTMKPFDVKLSDTVASLKGQIAQAGNVDPATQTLIYNMKQLRDDQTLASCGIGRESIINFICRLASSGLDRTNKEEKKPSTAQEIHNKSTYSNYEYELVETLFSKLKDFDKDILLFLDSEIENERGIDYAKR